MRKLIVISILLALIFITVLAYAGWVNGYTRRDGTYVNGYNRSDANSTVRDNYTYYGNTNPYTGQTGSNRYYGSPSSEYYNPYRQRSSGTVNIFGN